MRPYGVWSLIREVDLRSDMDEGSTKMRLGWKEGEFAYCSGGLDETHPWDEVKKCSVLAIMAILAQPTQVNADLNSTECTSTWRSLTASNKSSKEVLTSIEGRTATWTPQTVKPRSREQIVA